ncbi:MAG TPA: hypothetical protein VFZ66_25695 [Herpetosiphonaceae bacterium]
MPSGRLFASGPLLPLLTTLIIFAIVFPVLFYHMPRGLWVSIIYLTAASTEADCSPRTHRYRTARMAMMSRSPARQDCGAH